MVAADEGLIFHNRLTHTLEVAQVARRIAELWLDTHDPDLLSELGGLDPDVVEAAALAHDLGHPPFGHVAESELDRCVKACDVSDGFEANPQAFRIVTKLSVRKEAFHGLNLTKATLNAMLKYPWMRQTSGDWRERKFGAFHTEQTEFDYAREGFDDEWKSLEAEAMDWGDDIAYAVHDLEDFYRAGFIPLHRLLALDSRELSFFFDSLYDRWEREEDTRGEKYPRADLEEVFAELMDVLRQPSIARPYVGTVEQRASLRSLTALLISRYIGAAVPVSGGPSESRVARPEWATRETLVLKELTREYVINHPDLASQQLGQRRIVRELFEILYQEAEAERYAALPIGGRQALERSLTAATSESERRTARTRVVADIVAGMTERQAVAVHHRMTGISAGSVLQRWNL